MRGTPGEDASHTAPLPVRTRRSVEQEEVVGGASDLGDELLAACGVDLVAHGEDADGEAAEVVGQRDDADIGDVAADSRKGTHTTRAAQLLRLSFGGWVVDTPGVRQLELWDVISEEVEGFFVEFRPFVALCRFPNCSHTHETGCAVKQAVAAGLIATERYESYCRILEDE